jgi:glycine cleavage system aminomethyltransferase T
VYSAVVLFDVHVMTSLSLTGDEVTALVDKLTASPTVDNSALLLSVAGSGAIIAAFLVRNPFSDG